MGIFSSIMDKVFHHNAPAPEAAPAAAAAPVAVAAAAPVPAAAPAAPVDVEAVLTDLANNADDGGGHWDSSIVDLLKLLDLDSSLDARKTLADELNCHEGDAGTAEENIALHKAVMNALVANGGVVPDRLKG